MPCNAKLEQLVIRRHRGSWRPRRRSFTARSGELRWLGGDRAPVEIQGHPRHARFAEAVPDDGRGTDRENGTKTREIPSRSTTCSPRSRPTRRPWSTGVRQGDPARKSSRLRARWCASASLSRILGQPGEDISALAGGAAPAPRGLPLHLRRLRGSPAAVHGRGAPAARAARAGSAWPEPGAEPGAHRPRQGLAVRPQARARAGLRADPHRGSRGPAAASSRATSRARSPRLKLRRGPRPGPLWPPARCSPRSRARSA